MLERIVILGGGESGVGAALLAKRKGHEVFLSDNGLISSETKKILSLHNIEFEEGNHTLDKILAASEVVKSPGIPDDASLISQVKEKEIPVISEIEFAIRHSKAKFIGITGTNGKTTTTLLTYHILKENGLDVGLAGNVGYSLARQVAEHDREYFVVELSSFQLDGMYRSKLHIAILLNITPDHLDRYDNDFSKYVNSKFRIIRNMRKEDRFIYNIDNSSVHEKVKSLSSNVGREPISLEKSDAVLAYMSEKYIIIKDGDSDKRISKESLPMIGKHNYLNAMAAIRVARAVDMEWPGIIKALKTFENAPHRLEYSGNIKGVDFYNDSKATNVDAVWFALESFDNPVVLIMGGTDKGNDYTQIDELAKQKVKAIVALGIDNTKIEAHFKSYITDITSTDSAFRAVEIAYSKASEGEAVLLSPACASFDLFKNYEERGDRFKEAVFALKSKIENNLMMAI